MAPLVELVERVRLVALVALVVLEERVQLRTLVEL